MNFDDQLNQDQLMRAHELRKAMFSAKPLEARKDPPSPGKVARFDDVFGNDYEKISRAKELRRICKAEIYWDGATGEERESIRDACKLVEPFVGNDLLTKHVLRRDAKYLIKDERVREYVCRYVLGI